jgi:hypothetical protein
MSTSRPWPVISWAPVTTDHTISTLTAVIKHLSLSSRRMIIEPGILALIQSKFCHVPSSQCTEVHNSPCDVSQRVGRLQLIPGEFFIQEILLKPRINAPCELIERNYGSIDPSLERRRCFESASIHRAGSRIGSRMRSRSGNLGGFAAPGDRDGGR